ncbi:MAG: DMT family transporter [Actinomycetota bacterium]|nr:DMT family transporter [Actinomycetota bacterium]
MTVTLFALGLVLISGFLHAAWNLLAKRASGDASGPAFVWLYSALSTVIFAPLAAVVFVGGERVGPVGLLFVFGTGALHVGYFLSLQKGYQVGDLSVVYPLARGTGPLLASGAAILLLGERAGPVAWAGILLIVAGVFLLAWEPDGGRRSPGEGRLGVVFGVLTGAFIAAYTLWDKHAVGDLALSPVLYYWGSLLVQTVVLLPVALRRREEIRGAWQVRRPETLGVAVLSPVAYLLVLTALVFAPVSRVAPAREIGILIGTLLDGEVRYAPG